MDNSVRVGRMEGDKAKKLKSPKPEAGAGILTCPSRAREEPSESVSPPPTLPPGPVQVRTLRHREGHRGREREARGGRCQSHSAKGKLSLVEELCQAPPAPLPCGTYLGVEGLWLARLGLVVRGHGGLSRARRTWRTWGGDGSEDPFGPQLSHLGGLGPQHCRPCLLSAWCQAALELRLRALKSAQVPLAGSSGFWVRTQVSQFLSGMSRRGKGKRERHSYQRHRTPERL